MRFLLAFVLSFVSVFAIAQAPPMVVGGPQGIDVTRLLVRNWMTTPIYTDTPAAPLTGSGWPGRGYLITVIKNETACQNCPPKDTTLWMYTGARWKRVGYDYLTRLVYGGTVSKVSGQNLRYLIQPYGAFFDGDYKISSTSKTATLTSKTIDNTSRVDVLVLNRDSFQVKTGIPAIIPKKPLVTGSEVEVASFYFKAFDSIPTVINTSAKVTNIFRIPGIDSFYFNIDTLTFAVKDSVGITKNDTALMLNAYKFTAANGLTKDSTVFRLGGSLNQNTDINLNTRRLSFIGGSDTTRFFSNGRVSIGGTPDSLSMLRVNGTTRITGNTTYNGNLLPLPISGNALYAAGFTRGVNTNDKARLQAYTNAGGSPMQYFSFGFYETDLVRDNIVFDSIVFAYNNYNLALNGIATSQKGGGNTFNSLLINPTIRIGAANTQQSYFRGVSFSPVLDSFNNVRFVPFTNTVGSNMLNTTSGNTRIGYPLSTLTVNNTTAYDTTYKLDVNGNTRISGQLTFQPPQNTTQIRITAGAISTGGNSTQNSLISIGRFAGNTLTSSGGDNLIAIGESAGGSLSSGGRYSVMIGRGAGSGITTGEKNTIIGAGDSGNTPSNTSNAIHLVAGGGYEVNRADTTLLGLTSGYAFIGGGFNYAAYINDFYLGAGHRVRDPQLAHINLYAPSGFPTKVDTIGSNFTINAGRGTGAGAGGSIIFRTSQATTSGTTLQTLTERARISPTGSLLINTQSQTGADTVYKLDVNGDTRIDGKINFATRDIKIGTNSSGYNAVIAIGQQASVDNYTKVGVGRAVLLGFGNGNNWGTVGSNDISIGLNNKLSTSGSANGSIQLGASLRSSGSSILIGSNGAQSDSGFNVISIGGANIPTGSEFKFTANNQTYIRGLEYFLGTAGTDSVNVTINGNRASSSNKSGGNITIAGGRGNGNATPGAVIFSTSTRLPNAADTTTLQTLTERARISERGNLLVGTSTDDTSSLVNIVSTAKGFLQPRMTNTQRDAITTPATGLQLFSTTDSANYVYRGTGGGWQKIANEITKDTTIDFPSTGHGTSHDVSFTVTGAELGDVVSIGIPHAAMSANISYTAWVSATNQVTIRLDHYASSGNVDPASGTFKVKVFK